MPLTEAEEIEELKAMGIASRKQRRDLIQRKKNAERESGWNNTPFRQVPAGLRGIKCSTKEPWAFDEEVYTRKTGSFEYEVNAQEEYNDECAAPRKPNLQKRKAPLPLRPRRATDRRARRVLRRAAYLPPSTAGACSTTSMATASRSPRAGSRAGAGSRRGTPRRSDRCRTCCEA